MAMRRVVLDTNCLLQALPSRSPYHKIWTGILAGRIRLCVNTEILNEYEEILAQKTTAEIAHNVVEATAVMSRLLSNAAFLEQLEKARKEYARLRTLFLPHRG